MKAAAAPQDYVEIQHSRTPALAALRAAKGALCRFQQGEQVFRRQVRADDSGAIGVAVLGWADRRALDDRCCGHNFQTRIHQARQRCTQHAARAAIGVVADVGAQRNEVVVGQISSQMRP